MAEVISFISTILSIAVASLTLGRYMKKWLYDSLNAKIDEIKKDQEKITKQIIELEYDIKDIKSRLDDAKQSYEEIMRILGNVQNDINALNTTVNYHDYFIKQIIEKGEKKK
ncbi:hypothetical protein SBV1_gp26 [Sulfolobales Beppu virus 1]|nr:hypothetical protein SBV1_gp26 [Sulfolobales Beppu virus 1]